MMLESKRWPKISTTLEHTGADSRSECYQLLIVNLLQKILEDDAFCFQDDPELAEDEYERLHAKLPIVKTIYPKSTPGNISVFVLFKYRPNAFKFFFELIGRWLLPGKRPNITLFYAADFTMPELSKELYTIGELTIHIESTQELEEIQKNMPIIESEARLGIGSALEARRIMEIKGCSLDEKNSLIYEYLTHVVWRLPKYLNQDVFTEMQHLLVTCKDEFKASRTHTHLGKIIVTQHILRMALKEAVKNDPHKRHMFLKFHQAKLHSPQQEEIRQTLCMNIAVNFLKEHEIFEEKHILKAIFNYIPDIRSVEGSFFTNRRGSEHICTLYLEIEKTNGSSFTLQEISTLRNELQFDLKDRIEHLMHPIFMPRNEEEIMRNILTLSHQIKYLTDDPQVIITFDEQAFTHISFDVILVRIAKPGDPSLRDRFDQAMSMLEYIPDRCKTVGVMRKKYIKEATVFRVKVPSEPFLRQDNSIDLNKARQIVADEIKRVVGKFRDYNGGLITKQNEALCKIRDFLGDKVKYNDLILENFFYSITPVVMRTLLDVKLLKTLFLMLLDAIENLLFSGDFSKETFRRTPDAVLVMITTKDPSVKEEISAVCQQGDFQSSALANSYVKVYDIPCIGYVFQNSDPEIQQAFCDTISSIIERSNQPCRR